jgi:hypothetical protein
MSSEGSDSASKKCKQGCCGACGVLRIRRLPGLLSLGSDGRFYVLCSASIWIQLLLFWTLLFWSLSTMQSGARGTETDQASTKIMPK